MLKPKFTNSPNQPNINHLSSLLSNPLPIFILPKIITRISTKNHQRDTSSINKVPVGQLICNRKNYCSSLSRTMQTASRFTSFTRRIFCSSLSRLTQLTIFSSNKLIQKNTVRACRELILELLDSLCSLEEYIVKVYLRI